jgi:myo-inositol-1(or 4)-monophosphatase
MTASPGALLPVALHAADAARDLMRAGPQTVTEKSDRDLVSDVDLAIERAIRGYLQEATPGIGFLGEEEGQSGDAASGWLWTLDPIDGTSNYAHGIPLCAISLALLDRGRPVLAVIDAPFLGERYHAVEGQGAFMGDRRLTASTTSRLHDAIIAIGDYATGNGADRKNELRLAATVQLTSRVHRIRMIGTAALDLAWIADGRLDASITFANQTWDTAAGVLIAREAGARVTDADGNPHTISSDATIAAAPAIADQILALLRTADLTPGAQDTKVAYTSPHAALDVILSGARHLIFEFDGPICDLTAAMPSQDTLAGQLRALITAEGTSLPATITGTSRPAEILSAAAAISPELATEINAHLTHAEVTAAQSARPAAYVHEALAACRDSGRSLAILGYSSIQAVTDYLDRHSLTTQVGHVSALPAAYPPGHLQPAGFLLEETVRSIGATPEECALITASPASTDTARSLDMPVIGYATTPAVSERLTAGANCLIPSLADLTLRLRARPLPN